MRLQRSHRGPRAAAEQQHQTTPPFSSLLQENQGGVVPGLLRRHMHGSHSCASVLSGRRVKFLKNGRVCHPWRIHLPSFIVP